MAHRSIEVWDLETGEKIQTLLHSTKRTGVEDLAFSNDGSLLVSDGDGLLQLWQWERGLPAGTIEDASDFAFSPSGDTLATLFWSERGDYAEARFYPLDDLERFRAFRLDWAKFPSRIAYLPDGSGLLAMSGFELELVDPGSGEILYEAKGDDLLAPGGLGGFTNLTSELTEDGQIFLTAAVQRPDGSYGEGLGLWDPRSERCAGLALDGRRPGIPGRGGLLLWFRGRQPDRRAWRFLPSGQGPVQRDPVDLGRRPVGSL